MKSKMTTTHMCLSVSGVSVPPTPLDRLYIMHDSDVVHIGNENTFELFIRSFKEANTPTEDR